MSQKLYNSSVQNCALKRKNGVQNASQKHTQQKANSSRTASSTNRTTICENVNATSINEDEISPEIPNQNHRQMNTTEYQPTQSSDFQEIKSLFFEPSQANDDHTLIVLAPDSDSE